MANQAPTSSPAFRRSFDWELVDGEEVYADVESLDSFSISSGDGEDRRENDDFLGRGSDRDCSDEVSGVDLKVSGGCEDLEDDLVEEACEGGVVEEVGFEVDENRVVELSEGVNRGIYGEDEVESVENGGMRELRAPISRCVVSSRLIQGNYVENKGLLDLDEDEDGGCDDLEDDVVEEACEGGVIEQVGFQVSENPVLELEEVESVDIGVMRELRAPISRCVVSSRSIRGECVENHRRRGLLDLDEDEDGDGGYEVDVDDELVPWGVANRLEKQRMRKLGKRSFAKMNKSKKLAHFYTQPACVHGKHGLGLKAY